MPEHFLLGLLAIFGYMTNGDSSDIPQVLGGELK